MDINTAVAFGKTSVVVQILRADPSQILARNRLNDQPLHLAAHHRRRKILNLLLNLGAPVNEKGEHGRMPLYYAVNSASRLIVGDLLRHGADIGIKDDFGESPISLAAAVGNSRLIKQLLENRTNPDINAAVYIDGPEGVISKLESDSTAVADKRVLDSLLLDAIRVGSARLMEFLLSHGANPNATGKNRMPALLTAISEQQFQIVKLLVASGASLAVKDHIGQPLLNFAISCNAKPEIVDFLKSQGVKE